MDWLFQIKNLQVTQVKNEKYSRHQLIPGWNQNLLPDLNLAVIGAGGIGSLIIQNLACLGVGERRGFLSIIDPDVIEKSNLPRIPYAMEQDVGQPKVKTALKYILSKNPRIKVIAMQKSIQDEKAQNLLKQAHCILGAVDSEGARKILSEISHHCLIPYIDTGSEIFPMQDSYDALGQVRVMLPRRGCLFCIDGIDSSRAARDLTPKEILQEQERAGYVHGTSKSPAPSVIHLNGVIANLAISQFIKLIFGENLESQKMIIYNQQKMSLLSASFKRDDNCPLCGEYREEKEKIKAEFKEEIPSAEERSEA